MSRQRRRSGIVDGTTSTCPTCSGSGAVRSHEMAALRIIRAIEAEAISNRAAVIAATSTATARAAEAAARKERGDVKSALETAK